MKEPAKKPSDSSRSKERDRLLAAVFGDVLPEGTSDERPEGWGDRDDRGDGGGEDSGDGARDDEWLKNQVPPHHG